MPWWGWTLVGWTGLSIVLGLLIGRWRKSVRLTEEERAWPIRKADEQVPGKETALEYSARCPVCDQERPFGWTGARCTSDHSRPRSRAAW